MLEIYLAGAAAAFTVDLLVYPLDTLKTRIQSRDIIQTYASSGSSTQTAPTSGRPLFRGLYQGVGSVILATLPAAGIFFSVYEHAKDAISGVELVPIPLAHASASIVAEMAACIVITPAEVVKQNAQMMSQQTKESGSTSLRALRQLTGPGANRRLWSGYAALISRNVPYTAIQFPIFESIRARWWARNPSPDDKPRSLAEIGIVTGCSAAVSGAIAAVLTTPSDVLKTRMMLAAGDSSRAQADVRNGNAAGLIRKGALAVARDVYVTKGWRGLFRGGLLRAVWTAVGFGLYLGTYETSKAWLTRGKGGDQNIESL